MCSLNNLKLLNDLAPAVSLLGEPSKSFSPEERWLIEDVLLKAILEREANEPSDILDGLIRKIGEQGVVFDGDDASRALLSVVLADAGISAEEIRVCKLTNNERFEEWMLSVRTFEEQVIKRDSRFRIMGRRYLWTLSELWSRRFIIDYAYEADVLMRLYFGLPLGTYPSLLDKESSEDVAFDLSIRGIVSENDRRFLEKENAGQVRRVSRNVVKDRWNSVGLFCGTLEELYPGKARTIIMGRWSGPLSDFCWINDDFKDDVAGYIFNLDPAGMEERIQNAYSRAMISVALRERLLRIF